MFIKFNNTYSELSDAFYQKLKPTKVKNPELLYFNSKLADCLGIKYSIQDKAQITEILSGNEILDTAEPIALVYAGHQFGCFVPKLGDGRAILLGEVVDEKNQRFDIQLKGAGITSYSRNGDGRAALGPILREYIVSEAMYFLGIKTSRSLAVVKTGEDVLRNGKILPGAVLTRIAASHIRIGTFEYFASRHDVNSLKLLADYTINRHYPEIKNDPNPYISLLKRAQDRQIDLVVSWMKVGFIHGVMNTDNISIAGETLDYGPCAFIDEYDPNKVFSSIDYKERYSFTNQANICYWNLMQLAKCLDLIIDNNLEKRLSSIYSFENFKMQYEDKYMAMMCRKIGIIKPSTSDRVLVLELLNIMHSEAVDYTLTFRYLSYLIYDREFDYSNIFNPSESIKKWVEKWYICLDREPNYLQKVSSNMLRENPAIIPRNHQVEKAIKYAVEDQDFTEVKALLQAIANPYDPKQEKYNIEYMMAPKPSERVYKTFCGT